MTVQPPRSDDEHEQSGTAAITEQLRAVAKATEAFGNAARNATRGLDRVVIADHPELDDLNRELNNIYGGAFEEDPPPGLR